MTKSFSLTFTFVMIIFCLPISNFGNQTFLKKISFAAQLLQEKKYTLCLQEVNNLQSELSRSSTDIDVPYQEIFFSLLTNLEKDTSALLALTNLLPLFKEAYQYEKNREWSKVKPLYFQILTRSENMPSQDSFYLDEIMQGVLEQIILQKWQAYPFSESWLKNILEEKKQKKKIAYLISLKNSRKNKNKIPPYFSWIFTAGRINQNFLLASKIYDQDKLNTSLRQARKDKINFLLGIRYKIKKNNLYKIQFYILDTTTQKELFEVDIQSSYLDYRSFNQIQSIFFDLSEKIKHYSPVLGFTPLRITLTSEKSQEIKPLHKKFNLKDFTQNRLLFFQRSHLKELNAQKKIAAYHKALKEIGDFNSKSPQHISEKDYLKENHDPILNVLSEESELVKVMAQMKQSIKEKKGNLLFKLHLQANKILSGLYYDYPLLSPLIKELESDLAPYNKALKENKAKEKKEITLQKTQEEKAPTYKFFLGATYQDSRAFQMADAEDFPSNYGLTLLATKNVYDELLLLSARFNYFLPRETNLLNSGVSYAKVSNYVNLDFLVGGDLSLPVFPRTHFGIMIDLGPNFAYSVMEPDSEASSVVSTFGYKALAGVFIQLDLFFSLRLEAYYELGKTGQISHQGQSFSLLMNLLNF